MPWWTPRVLTEKYSFIFQFFRVTALQTGLSLGSPPLSMHLFIVHSLIIWRWKCCKQRAPIMFVLFTLSCIIWGVTFLPSFFPRAMRFLLYFNSLSTVWCLLQQPTQRIIELVIDDSYVYRHDIRRLAVGTGFTPRRYGSQARETLAFLFCSTLPAVFKRFRFLKKEEAT